MDKNKYKDFILNSIGIFLLLMGLARILQSIFFVTPIHVFWLCNHVPFIMGIAILFRKPIFLMSEFLLLFMGQIFWIVKMFLGIFNLSNSQLIADILLKHSFFDVFSLSLHLTTLPLALCAILIFKKENKNAWAFAIPHAMILLPIMVYFGKTYNLNCFLSPCTSLIKDFFLYPFVLFVGYFAIMKILNLGLDNLVRIYSRKNPK